jgi:hypothetical protein
MSDGEALLGLIPLVVGAGITLAAINYLLPEGKSQSIHDAFATKKVPVSALEAAGF